MDHLLSLLEKVSRHGDSYKACCPAHDDKNPSLTLKKIPDGRILIHCFAGCSPNEVLTSLGMSLGDLYPDGAAAHHLEGWERIKQRREDIQEKRLEDTLSKHRIYLLLCDSKRRQGERLTPSELKKEREAYRMVHENDQRG